MNFTKFFIIFGVWMIGSLLHDKIVYPAEKPLLTFGQFQAQFTDQQRKNLLGQQLSTQDALILPFGEEALVFYPKNPLKANLSVFKQGNEQVLDSFEVTSGLVPRPVLASGILNANNSPDVLFCYSIDHGVSNSTEHYEQYMMLLLDGQRPTYPPILLSASNWSHAGEQGSTGNEIVYLDNGEGKPGFKQKALVMLFPASQHIPSTFYIWSRREVYVHPPTHTKHSVTYHVTTYQLEGNQLVMTNDISDTAKATAITLRGPGQGKASAGRGAIVVGFYSSSHELSAQR